MWVITFGVVRPLMLSSIWFKNYRPQRSWGKILFSQASVILSTGGGACMAEGVRGWWGLACMARGHAWWGGGMCGRGACVAGGMCGWRHVWRGMHDRECVWQGTCVIGGVCDTHAPPGRYYGYGIWSMSGRYSSYWNAFLFLHKMITKSCRYNSVLISLSPNNFLKLLLQLYLVQ